MQRPDNAYRPVFLAGAERAPLDAAAKAPVPAHTAPATQPPAVDLPRLQLNVSPNQPHHAPSQGAATFPQQGVMFPDIAVFGQLDQSVPRMALLHPLHMQQPGGVPERRAAGGRTRSQSDYASRHLAAEHRRRTRINERLERLRTIVPHAERTNTATFLEQVYSHIEQLNARAADLKSQVEARDSTIQELMCRTGTGGMSPLEEQLNGHEDPGSCAQGLMKDEGVEIQDGGVIGGAGLQPPAGEDPWMGLKDEMKRGPLETEQEAVKRMRT